MRILEPFLPFTRNLLCKRIRFDDKLDLIDKIIPIDDKTCLLIDRVRNFHLKAYSPEDEDAVCLQFPIPPYAHNSNPNVLYSVDYTDLYHYIHKKKISEEISDDYIYNLDQQRTKYIQFVYLGDSKLAVQLSQFCPVAILDLHQPKNPPTILPDVYGVKNLISLGNGCLAWYQKSQNMVILYHSISQKRKILNFTESSIKELYSLKDHVIVAVSKRQIEILDYVKNKVIKTIGFINDAKIPEVVVHSEANIISYIEDKHIHIWKTDKGRIKWQNYYDFRSYGKCATFKFIAPNLIALKTCCGEPQILFFDSKSVALHTEIDASMLGFADERGLEYLCCGNFRKTGTVRSIHPLGNNSFGVIESFCRLDSVSHGQQRVSVFKLENLTFENAPGQLPNVDSTKFEISKRVIFEEFRDPIRAIDIFDDTFGMFITEKARVFRVNLKDYSVKEIIELRGLVKQNGFDVEKIEKFFVLSKNRVAIVIRWDDECTHPRIVVFALDTRTVDFDSNDLMEETEEEPEYSFYDVIKVKPNKLFLSFQTEGDLEQPWRLGLIEEDDSGEAKGYVFNALTIHLRDQIKYDRLWNLEESLVAMRHLHNSCHLSFLRIKKKEVKIVYTKFRAENLVNVGHQDDWSYNMPGVIDVKPINKDVVCIQIKKNIENETVFLVYNIKTEELLNKIDSSTNMIGTIKNSFRRPNEEEYQVKRENLMIFGDYAIHGNNLHFESINDFLNEDFNSIQTDGRDTGLCITARNFKPLKTQDRALVYESDHHQNFVCVLKSPNYKLEFLRVFQTTVGKKYHEYIYKSVFETIFGVNENNDYCMEMI